MDYFKQTKKELHIRIGDQILNKEKVLLCSNARLGHIPYHLCMYAS